MRSINTFQLLRLLEIINNSESLHASHLWEGGLYPTLVRPVAACSIVAHKRDFNYGWKAPSERIRKASLKTALTVIREDTLVLS